MNMVVSRAFQVLKKNLQGVRKTSENSQKKSKINDLEKKCRSGGFLAIIYPMIQFEFIFWVLDVGYANNVFKIPCMS